MFKVLKVLLIFSLVFAVIFSVSACNKTNDSTTSTSSNSSYDTVSSDASNSTSTTDVSETNSADGSSSIVSSTNSSSASDSSVVSSSTNNQGGVKTLNGKKVLISGDSIAAGWRDTAYGKNEWSEGGGWAARISNQHNALVTNAAVAGSTFTEISGHQHIIEQLHKNKNTSFDYVVLQGGFNDAMESAPIGTVSNSKDPETFDKSGGKLTFAGSIDELFYYATTYFKNAKIGFIITYSTPCSGYGGRTGDVTAMRQQWDVVKTACDKWGISYLDLCDGKNSDGVSYTKLLDSENEYSSYFYTGGKYNIHINTAGYDLITPDIVKWLLGL